MIIDTLNEFSANILISKEEYAARREALIASGGFPFPESQTPWQQYFREMVEPFDKGMTLRGADVYQDVARKGMPRDNH